VDHAGRPGLGIETELGGYLHQLVFDPGTGHLLGEQETLMSPSPTTPRLARSPAGRYTSARNASRLYQTTRPAFPGRPVCPARGASCQKSGPDSHMPRADPARAASAAFPKWLVDSSPL
jgi:hypothetical protein